MHLARRLPKKELYKYLAHLETANCFLPYSKLGSKKVLKFK